MLSAQNGFITLQNPSFEGTPGLGGSGELPQGWLDCGFPGETPPDVHPIEGGGNFSVTTQPSDGDSYLGLVARDNDTWEMVSQQLTSPLAAGKTYDFSIDLCRSQVYISASRTTNEQMNYATPVILRIWAGETPCDRMQLLASSPLIINSDWITYDFELMPAANYQCIILEVHYKPNPPFAYNGNLLLDNASEIIER